MNRNKRMNPFQKLIDDVFATPDFLEDCLIGGLWYKCIVSPVGDGIVYTDGGMESEENFTLDLKIPLKHVVKENDRIKFRDKWYKVLNTELDSANTSVKLHIIALSKGIE